MNKSYNRQKNVFYKIPGSSVNNSYNEHLTYDLNGNILSLKRNGEIEDEAVLMEIDDLDYDYEGNQLINVIDKTNHPAGFNDGNDPQHTQLNDFEYDDYGNMVEDRNKKITNITYNHLNLPKKITFENNRFIEYIYGADGSKLRKTVTEGSKNKTVDYLNGFQYTNETLEFFPHAEGYVTVNTNQLNDHYNYVFNYTDHLGNIRLKYTAHPQTGETQPLEENHYYPFGLTHDGYQPNHKIIGLEGPGANVTIIPTSPNVGDPYKYKFGGKEYQDEFDINFYDFGARNYDAALGRWMNLDPLAEERSWVSPYNFVQNNPIMRVDPTGALDAPIYDTDGAFLGTDDQGLQGKGIVMDAENFTQGMSHDDAMSHSLGAGGLNSKEAGSKLVNHYDGLKDRPDYDGFVTIAEGINWAKSHPNADFNDPSNSLYLDASKLDFGKMDMNELTLNEFKNVNLLNSVNMSKWSSIHTTYALGNTAIKLINSHSKQVQLKGDIYDWDYHNYDPKSGKIPSSKRDRLILLERLRTGINDSHGFPLKIYGTGKLN